MQVKRSEPAVVDLQKIPQVLTLEELERKLAGVCVCMCMRSVRVCVCNTTYVCVCICMCVCVCVCV